MHFYCKGNTKHKNNLRSMMMTNTISTTSRSRSSRRSRISFFLSSYYLVQIMLLLILVLLVGSTTVHAQDDGGTGTLLDAYNAPLSAMTNPGNFYFLEFPLSSNSENNDDDRSTEAYTTLSPKCGNGSPYQFAFKRGTDQHLSKLIVELEGGPACWKNIDGENKNGEGSCDCSIVHKKNMQTPWYEYLKTKQQDAVKNGYFPPLNSCTGITKGFTKMGSNVLFGLDEIDIPIGLRNTTTKTTTTKTTKGRRDDNDDDDETQWWEFLSGPKSNIDDWSYILVPHCTLDWHLGHQPKPKPTTCGGNNNKVYHRGGTNLQAVVNWINDQYTSLGGLDALVVMSGGNVAGCGLSSSARETSSIAPLIFANSIATDRYISTTTTTNNNNKKKMMMTDDDESSSSSMLAIVEGSGLFNHNSQQLPTYDQMMNRWNAKELIRTTTTGGNDYGNGLLDTAKSLMTTSSSPGIKYAWLASSENLDPNIEETQWLDTVKSQASSSNSFHFYTPFDKQDSEVFTTCPRYASPNVPVGEQLTFSSFIRNFVTNQMSWGGSSDNNKGRRKDSNKKQQASNSSSSGSTRLSFFSVTVIIGCLIGLSYIIYYVIKYRREQQQQQQQQQNNQLELLPPPHTYSPYELWLIGLTQYPRIFLGISLFIPILLSSLALTKSDNFRVNLDFNMYLNISSEIEDVARSYNIEIDRQVDSLDRQERNCAVLTGQPLPGGPPPQGYRGRRRDRNLLFQDDDDEEEEDGMMTKKMMMNPLFGDDDRSSSSPAFHFYVEEELGNPPPIPQEYYDLLLLHDEGQQNHSSRNLQSAFGPFVTIMYTNRNGGNILEPEVLEQIRQFEESLMNYPEFFPTYCYGFSNRCMPFDSIIPRFFPGDGIYPGNQIVQDVDGVLQSFLSDPSVIWKMDQYFGPGNLRSNVTRTFVWLRDLGDGNKAVNKFLDEMYKNLLWKDDRSRPYKYPDMVYSWSNSHLERHEAEKALMHDAIWSAGSLIFIGVMIFLKVRNSFVFLSSMLGLTLAFTTSYYWVSIHFDIQQITLLHVSSLFVMLGIGADDIFLMIDSFEHTKLEYPALEDSPSDDEVKNGSDLENFADEGDEEYLSLLEEQQKQKSAEIIRKRMKSAYSTAGSMMLVSSLTTAVCFFSNAFGVLVVIQQFGIFMGTVVIVNYIHVMTILPSSIMVYELYILPWKRDRPPPTWSFVGLMMKPIKKFFPNLLGAASEEGKSPGDTMENEGIELASKSDKTEDKTEKTEFSDSQSLALASICSEGGSRKAPYFQSQCSLSLGSNAEDASAKDFFDDENTSVAPTSKGGRQDVKDTTQMNRLDRWLVVKYTPFLSTRYKLIVYVSVALALVLGAFGIIFFEMSDGSIVLFSDKYNLGRLQSVNDAYYNNDISKTVESADVRGWMENAASGKGGGDSSSGGSSSGGSSGSNSGGGNPGVGPGGSTAPGNSGGGGGIPGPEVNTVRPETPQPILQPTLAPTLNPTPQPTIEPTYAPTMTKKPNAATVGGGFGVVAETTDETDAPAAGPGTGGGGIGVSSPPPVAAANPLAPTPESSGCAKPCQNGGTCDFMGKCSCQNGWDGEQCTIPVCPVGDNGEICSGNGSCTNHPNELDGSTICSCPPQYQGSVDCSKLVELARREAIIVRLIWGVEPEDDGSNLWIIRNDDAPNQELSASMASSTSIHDQHKKGGSIPFDLSEPQVQGWLYEVVQMARNDPELYVQPDRPTWIELFQRFIVNQGLEFPVPKELFVGYIELLKKENLDFAELIKKEIGTASPGLSGEFTFTSITLQADVLTSETAVSFTSFEHWSRFVNEVNLEKPSNVARVFAQSRAFLDAYRAQQTVDSTLATWFVANGLCLLIILAFSQNILLCLMVMASITLIFLCLGGLLFFFFKLPFGPVEALGVSIFIGLSANYSLHVVHAFHTSNKNDRQKKVEDAIFSVGSPIVASALSTIGGSIFLFGCRTYVFVELGILICSITTMALLYSMGFLLAWLKMIGPLPCDSQDTDDQGTPDHHRHRLHYWDLKALYNAVFHSNWKVSLDSFWIVKTLTGSTTKR